MSKPRLGIVKFVHVLAEHPCERCGNDCLRMTRAEFDNGVVANAAEMPPGEIVCNACNRKERDAENAAIKKARQQTAWAKQARRAKPARKGKKAK